MAEMIPYLHAEPGDEPQSHWTARAACRGRQHLFDAAADGDPAAIDAAVAICATCPVRAECLDHARRVRARHGVWGGAVRVGRRDDGRDREPSPAPRDSGADHPRHRSRAKITAEQVREIRRRAAAGEPHTGIAEGVGLSQPYVSKIVRREAWRHIA